jgi:hypothetical protein
MAWVLFIDESGHDRKASPYEVLAGIAVRDRDLWPLIGGRARGPAADGLGQGFRAPAARARFAQPAARLRYRAERPRQGRDFAIWSFAHIADLRTRSERELDG